MEVLGERPVWSMSDSEKLSALDAVVAEKARLETLELHLIAGIDQSGYAAELGARDTARLLTHRYRTDAPEARRQVRVATHLTKYAATSTALPDPATPFTNPATARSATGDGDSAVAEAGAEGTPGSWRVSPAQAAAIVSILDQVPSTVRVENIEVAEEQLINLAATHTPTELRRAGRKIRDLLDPDGPEPDEKAAYTRESLSLKTVDRGVTFRGYLANENAELFRTLIHAHAKPHKTIDGQLDPRSRDKRQADALTTILTAAGTATTAPTGAVSAATASRAGTHTSPEHSDNALPGDLAPDGSGGTRSDTGDGSANDVASSAEAGFVPGHGPKPHISITIDYNDLAAATTNATGDMIFGDNLSAATVRRLACDAQILPIVLGTKSQPLDVGTTQRLVTRPMRRALNARDKGCVICNAPPIQCEAHHIISWLDGGITAVSNLALLCKRDHLDLHSGHWQIRIVGGVVQVTNPTWANPIPIPQNKYKPPTAEIVHQPATPPLTPWDSGEPADARVHDPAAHASSDGRGLATPTTQPPSDAPSDPSQPAPFNPWADDEPAAPTASLTCPTPANLVAPTAFDPRGDDEPGAQKAGPGPAMRANTRGPAGLVPWAADEPASRATDRPPPEPANTAGPAPLDPWSDDEPAA